MSSPGQDFDGGELMLVEIRPRRQARGRVVSLQQGEAVIFPVHHRSVQGWRGWYRATMRHGVSPLHEGRRYALGIIIPRRGLTRGTRPRVNARRKAEVFHT